MRGEGREGAQRVRPGQRSFVREGWGRRGLGGRAGGDRRLKPWGYDERVCNGMVGGCGGMIGANRAPARCGGWTGCRRKWEGRGTDPCRSTCHHGKLQGQWIALKWSCQAHQRLRLSWAGGLGTAAGGGAQAHTRLGWRVEERASCRSKERGKHANTHYAPGNSLRGAGGRGQGGETLWANRIRTCRSAGQSNAMKPSPQLCLKAGETACSSK